METILVTGASGFVGSHLLHALASTDPSSALVAWRRPRSSGHPESAPPGANSVQWQDVDILDRDRVAAAIGEIAPVQIYHCAGAAAVRGSWTNTTVPLEVNVRGTEFLLDAVAASSSAARILIPGSALIYKPSTEAVAEEDAIGPVSPYGVSKLAQEMLGRRWADEGLAVVVTRSFTHLGPGQSRSYAASSFASQVARIEAGKSPPVIEVGSLDARRDLTDVRDTVQAYIALMSRGQPGRPYNVCSGESHRIGDVLDGLLQHAQVKVTVRTDPTRLRPQDNDVLLGDRNRITSEIGWRPRIPLETTLHDLLAFWRGAIDTQSEPS